MSTPHWQTAVFCSGIEISCVLWLHHLQHVVCRKGKNIEPCSWKILWSSPGSIIYHFHPVPFIGQRLSIWWTLTSRKAGKCSPSRCPGRRKYWGKHRMLSLSRLSLVVSAQLMGGSSFLALQLTEGQVLKLTSLFSGFSTFLPCAVQQGKGHRSLSASPKPMSA